MLTGATVQEFVVVTSLSGQFNLFANLELATPLPGPGAADYSAIAVQWQDSESLAISSADAQWANRCTDPTSCLLTIAVTAVRPGNFSIYVRSPTQDLILIPGIPVVAQLSFGSIITKSIQFELPLPQGSNFPSITFDITGLDVPLIILIGSDLIGNNPSLYIPGARPPAVACGRL